ncbi:unnamed protein product [Pylaiella littoralis]
MLSDYPASARLLYVCAFLQTNTPTDPAQQQFRGEMMALRYIDNEIRDFQPPDKGGGKKERKNSKGRKADGLEHAMIHSALRLSLQRILRETPPAEGAKSRDFSIYTGTAGYCLLFLVLHSRGIGFGVAGRTGQLAGFASPLELAAAYLDAAQASLDRQVAKRGATSQASCGITFLTGAAGVHAVGAAVAQRTGDEARCRRHAREVASMEELALSEDEPRSHDILNGLAGYLSALLFVRANTREGGAGEGRRRRGGKGRRGASNGDTAAAAAVDADAAKAPLAAATATAAAAAAAAAATTAAAAQLAAAAKAAGASDDSEYGGVLTYEWHAKMYLGAARGVSGILFVLMQALQTVYGASLLVEARAGEGTGTEDLPPQAAEQLYLIRSTVDAVSNTVLPEGNFPSTPVSADDRLVQWCHGASGVIPMLTKAHEVFEDDRYLEMARYSSEAVWKRGLLTKGNGICHGVAGNGYAFLSLRKADGTDGRHLHRARRFAGFAASAVLGPNPSAGANAYRGDPFGPGAHAHPRGGGGFGLGRTSSHDAGKSMPSVGWPSTGGGSGGSGGGNGCGGGGGGGGSGGGGMHSKLISVATPGSATAAGDTAAPAAAEVPPPAAGPVGNSGAAGRAGAGGAVAGCAGQADVAVRGPCGRGGIFGGLLRVRGGVRGARLVSFPGAVFVMTARRWRGAMEWRTMRGTGGKSFFCCCCC